MSADQPHQQQRSLLHLAFCAFGICSCFLYFSMIQERLYTEHKMGALFVLVLQCITNCLVAYTWKSIDMMLTRQKVLNNNKLYSDISIDKPKQAAQQIDHKLFLLAAACYVAAMGCSNQALHYVAYPTAVLAKSCKLIPTMVMGVLVEGKKYSAREWMAAAFITSGIVLFNLSRMGSKNNDESENSWLGISLLFISLGMDGMLGACQGLLKKRSSGSSGGVYRPPSAMETMLFLNFYALIFLFPLSIASNQWQKGIAMFSGEHAEEILSGTITLNMAAALGQIFIFLTITWFSALVCTTITTTRKFFTILFSVLYFGHQFSNLQWISVVSVFTGLFMAIGAQKHKMTARATKSAKHIKVA